MSSKYMRILIKKLSWKGVPLRLDVTNEKSIDLAIKKIKKIDILINNAALNPTLNSLKKIIKKKILIFII